MNIYVNLLFINMTTETFKINIKDNTTLIEAKQLITEQSCVYPEEQVWFINNIPLKTKIEWNKDGNYSIIVNSKWYNFKVKTMSGNIIDVNYLTSRDKVSILKYHIYEKLKLNPKSYKLITKTSKGTITLEDDYMIGKYFIPNNSTINLVISLVSGF
jgi:hypothetical protein